MCKPAKCVLVPLTIDLQGPVERFVIVKKNNVDQLPYGCRLATQNTASVHGLSHSTGVFGNPCVGGPDRLRHAGKLRQVISRYVDLEIQNRPAGPDKSPEPYAVPPVSGDHGSGSEALCQEL
jgi:hypothetical protein